MEIELLEKYIEDPTNNTYKFLPLEALNVTKILKTILTNL